MNCKILCCYKVSSSPKKYFLFIYVKSIFYLWRPQMNNNFFSLATIVFVRYQCMSKNEYRKIKFHLNHPKRVKHNKTTSKTKVIPKQANQWIHVKKCSKGSLAENSKPQDRRPQKLLTALFRRCSPEQRRKT